MEYDSIRWDTVEYIHTAKSSDWFWALGIISVSIAVVAIILNNILFAIFILLSAFVLAMFAHRKPNPLEVEINKRGVRVGEYFYPHSTLESFNVVHYPHCSKLIIKSQKMFMPYITVLIEEVDPDLVADFLDEFIPQDEHVESFGERLIEFLGF